MKEGKWREMDKEIKKNRIEKRKKEDDGERGGLEREIGKRDEVIERERRNDKDRKRNRKKRGRERMLMMMSR